VSFELSFGLETLGSVLGLKFGLEIFL
jgi:hypothetical protein